jgi:hypothetical protein
MSTTITIKLNKDAHQFQAGDSTGFGIRGGVQYYDRETKQKEWTNYEAAIFAKAPGQVQYYNDVLRAGSVVEVTAKLQKVKTFDGQSGQMLSIELIDASIGFVHTGQAPQQAQQQAPQQQPVQQPPQGQAPQQHYQQPQQNTQTPPPPQMQHSSQQAPQQQQQRQDAAAGREFVDDSSIPFR